MHSGEIAQSINEESNDGGNNRNAAYIKKLNNVAYRMLNALRTGNKYSFIDTLALAHMYSQIEIPGIFTDYLDDDMKFKNVGYAFITGMLGNDRYMDNNQKANGGGISHE